MIFVDVGAHEGQTLAEVTKAAYGFDMVVAFEPSRRHADDLAARFPNVHVVNAALSDGAAFSDLYGTNDIGEASLFPSKNDVDATVSQCCMVLDAAQALTEIGGPMLLKLNCEGSEVNILRSLIKAGVLGLVHDVMIDFDIRKVPGREHEEQDVLQELRDAGFSRFSLCDNVMRGATHQDRIANWLRGVL